MSEQETQAVAAEVAEAKSKLVVITAENPTSEELKALTESIRVNYDFSVVVKPVEFKFKKSVDKATGIETIREAVQLAIPYPSVEGIVKILETGGKELELLLDAMETVVNAQARDILYDGTSLTAATFPVDKLCWKFIAEIPKATRRGGGIPKEVWEAFGQDYVEIMPQVTGKSLEQIANAAKLLLGKLTGARTNEPVLQLLVSQLALYAEHSPNFEEYSECVDFLLNKADTYLNTTEEELLANL